MGNIASKLVHGIRMTGFAFTLLPVLVSGAAWSQESGEENQAREIEDSSTNTATDASQPLPLVTRLPNVLPDGRELPSETAVIPDGFSFILNTSLGYSRSSSLFNDERSEFEQFLLGMKPLIRTEAFGGLTLQSEVRLAWDSEMFSGLGFEQSENAVEVQRGATTLTRDFYNSAIRLQIGDVLTHGRNFQNASRLVGISIGREYLRIQPNRNILSDGRRGFLVERPSRVQIFAGDTLLGQEFLDPGAFDVSELISEFAGEFGPDQISLQLIDDTGRADTINFSNITAFPLLPQGVIDFGFAAGASSRARPDTLEYDFNEAIVSAYVSYGFSSSMSVGAEFQTDRDTQVLGFSDTVDTRIGTLQLRAAVSQDRREGGGLAAGIGFSTPFSTSGPRVSVDWQYRSDSFTAIRESEDGSTPFSRYGYPQQALIASVGNRVGSGTYVTIGADWRRILSRDLVSNHLAHENRWTAYAAGDVRLTRNLSLRVNLSMSQFESGEPTTYAGFLRIRRAFGGHYSGDVSYKSRNRQTAFSINHTPGFEIDQFIGRLHGAYENGDPDRYSLTADLDYEGNRFTAFGYHSEDRRQALDDYSNDSFVQLDAALVYADGTFAVGKQVHNAGFAIVRPLASAVDEPVYVDDWGGQEYRARSGFLGPAVVNQITPYTNRVLDLSARQSAISADPNSLDLGEEQTSRIRLYMKPGGGVLIEPSGETRENHTGGIDDAPETEGTTTMPVASQQNQEEVNEVPHKP